RAAAAIHRDGVDGAGLTARRRRGPVRWMRASSARSCSFARWRVMTGTVSSRFLPPFLGLAACLSALLLPGAAWPQEARTGDLPALRQQALELVNTARRERELETLTLSDPLNAAAQHHAED